MSLDRDLVVAALPNYEIGDEVGRGGWGVVLQARHRDLDREVAIKQLPVAFAADANVRARFKEEARTVARLDHPHIAPVYDFVEQDGLCLILLEYLPGGTLWDKFSRDGVQLDAACAYIIVAASALAHAHERDILHRDIKPENFLFDDRPGIIKLSDFGISKVLGAAAANLTAAGQIIGTPAYMAPEQVLGKPLTPATDIYACGTMLYEMLTGDLPFPDTPDPMQQLIAKVDREADDVRVHRPDLPDGVAEVVMRSIAPAPGDRYASAQEYGEELAKAATAELGRGWLRRSGVGLHGNERLLAITERSPGDMTVSFEVVHDQIRATAGHTRLGDLVAEARRTIPPGSPGAVPVPAPAAAEVPAVQAVVIQPAAWHPDPTGRYGHRWWDGERWTAFASANGVIVNDPL